MTEKQLVARTPCYETNEWTGGEYLAGEIFELRDAQLTLWYEGPEMRTEDDQDVVFKPTLQGLRDFAKVCRVAANWVDQHRRDWHKRHDRQLKQNGVQIAT